MASKAAAAFLCSCLGLLWGLSTFFVTSLEDNHQRRGRKLYFLESNEKEVERSKQTNPGTDLKNIWNSLEITLELKYRVIQKVRSGFKWPQKALNSLKNSLKRTPNSLKYPYGLHMTSPCIFCTFEGYTDCYVVLPKNSLHKVSFYV